MPELCIAAAQVRSIRGDVESNIRTHLAAIQAAAANGAMLLIFPELSLTGYEPDLAEKMAMEADDTRLASLGNLAQERGITVVVGAPLRSTGEKPRLAAIVFGSDGTRRTYSKMHLGGMEPHHFTAGTEPLMLSAGGHVVGLAICADAAKPSHPRHYAAAGAKVYAAGVFLNEAWFATDAPRLHGYAIEHRLAVVMANHADSVGTERSVGRSAIWAPDGSNVIQADGTEACLLMARTDGTAWSGLTARLRPAECRTL
jgi:predicted amidohydrolase